jgi:hypothetical protein
LVLVVLLPVYRVLAGPETGFPGVQAVEYGDRYYRGLWIGVALVGVGAALAGLAVRAAFWKRLGAVTDALTRLSSARFAAALAGVSGLLTLGFTIGAVEARPVLNDAMAQLIHARYLAVGALAGPHLPLSEFWNMQFMLNTAEGWVSQYPPGHAAVLALGVRVGAVWLAGPLIMAATAFMMSLVAERLLPERRAVARLGAALVAVSPFLIGLAGTYMNHATAALWGIVAAYCALRALERWPWAIGAGAAVGMLTVTRPLSGLVIGAVVTLGVWLLMPSAAEADRRGRKLALRVGATLLGGLPFAAAFAAYNARFFGGATRLGYVAAAGSSHGLGFHIDPWGNQFGPLQGLGYTVLDLLALGRDLVGTPIPLVALVGLFLLVVPRLSPGVRVLCLWALALPVVNAFYWHHDLVLGPRMLGEVGPAWCVLAGVATVGVIQWLRGESDSPRAMYLPSVVTAALAISVVVGVTYVGPRRLLALSPMVGPGPVTQPPDVREPSLVFVPDSWNGRLGARLSARGVRLDTVRVVLQNQPPCTIQRALDGSASPNARECQRQVLSDRYGALGIPYLLWQGDLPGLPPKGAMWVRDLGPTLNARLLDRYPDRSPHVLLPPIGGRGWALVSYREGMSVLWGETPDG